MSTATPAFRPELQSTASSLLAMARAIIRYSFDGDDGKAIRTEIRKRLSTNFVQRGKTASWESRPNARLSDLVGDLRWALERVQTEIPDGARVLDHIWIYIDDPSSPPN
jgi:hypothetical protein